VPITETARHDMLIALESAIGKEAAMTMADHLPPVGWADVATKHDIDIVRLDMIALESRITTKVELLLERKLGETQRVLFFAILGAFVANTGIVLGVIQSRG